MEIALYFCCYLARKTLLLQINTLCHQISAKVQSKELQLDMADRSVNLFLFSIIRTILHLETTISRDRDRVSKTKRWVLS